MPPRELERSELLRRALKPRDFWWTVAAIDPIAVRLLPPLLRARWVTPTGLSLAALVIGMGSLVAFALGAMVLGAIVYQIRFLLDCLDGKLARATGHVSEWGRFVDLAGDTTIIGGAYASIGLFLLTEGTPGSWAALPLLFAFSVAVWLHQYQRGVRPAQGPAAVEHPPGPVRIWSWHRLYRHPGAVEIETLVLLVYPVAFPREWFPYVAGVATAFYLASSADVIWDLQRRLANPTAAE